jgi:hypothetical protein
MRGGMRRRADGRAKRAVAAHPQERVSAGPSATAGCSLLAKRGRSIVRMVAATRPNLLAVRSLTQSRSRTPHSEWSRRDIIAPCNSTT